MALRILHLALVLLVAIGRGVHSQSVSDEVEVADQSKDTEASHECTRTPPKCANEGGFCLNLALPCAGKMDEGLCNNKHCGCCMKHECANTPKKCATSNGVCVNLSDYCAGKTDDSLCNNRHCTCCKKHVCSNTTKRCQNAGGNCINVMDACDGSTDYSLCFNKHCTCCIPRD
ncbi:low-density lipoprotein receptor-related protein 2-like [Penaeus monodon]|uniref:low-density lipoprotein receptor-related protein 2-like n=1 Tax=Penaeus monodon TaxID=6687 RepID=UPI0018A73961|nr:low-density lipoprotein receptor-related protein 2-like [Penaeus monodon]